MLRFSACDASRPGHAPSNRFELVQNRFEDYQSAMIALPLPLVSSLILGFLFLRLMVQDRRTTWVAALLGMLALQGGIITLAQHHGMEMAQVVQPVTAMMLPPLAWLAWKADGMGQRVGAGDFAHAAPPALALALVETKSLLLDTYIPLVYAGYGLAICLALHNAGPDLPRARLGQGGLPRLVWGGVAAALCLSALSDFGIALALALGQAAHVALIIDLSTSAILFGMGLLALAAVQSAGSAPDEGPAEAGAPSEDDQALVARLDALMQSRQPWRDPDLTLAQLARRLSVPAKRLSTAVNLVTGENISRHVNGHRIRAACAALKGGANATEAMLEGGFITKSNFNREFRRVTGKTPTTWQAEHRT